MNVKKQYNYCKRTKKLQFCNINMLFVLNA